MSKAEEPGSAAEPEQTGGPESTSDLPWWLAGDATYAGARPLFDPVAAAESGEQDHEGADEGGDNTPPTGSDSPGTSIAEALRFASALAAWSNETGLTDTLKALWEEAATSMVAASMATAGPADSEPDGDEATGTDATGTETSEDATDPPPIHLRIVPDDAGTTPTACEFCPLCRGYEAMRHVQPQMSEGLAEAMSSLTAALNLAIDSLSAQQRRR